MNPALYHGRGKKPPFFEGWYYKIVSADEKSVYAVIPGISLSPDPGGSHAFIQFFDGRSGRVDHVRFGTEEFQADRKILDLRIGKNRFTADALDLDLSASDLHVRGRLEFSGLTPWPVSLRSPGIMGWYAWVPGMECFHGIISLDHSIGGRLIINGEKKDFSGGRGYTEKDWGRSFPKAWIWSQTNHFSEPGTSLTASLAIIPWIRRPFPGFIVGFRHGGRLYRFATYTGARMESLALTEDKIVWAVGDRDHRLEMCAWRRQGGSLHAPTAAGMTGRILESLDAEIKVKLSERRGAELLTVYEGPGRNAGLESAGDLEALIAMWRLKAAVSTPVDSRG
jgi:tocopherol cyclase